jgi:hypothetical protein
VLIAGLVTTLGGWLAGPGKQASQLRARIAPWLTAQPEAAYGIAAVAYLALVAWGPLTVLRRPLAIAVLGALLLAGIVALRAQAKRELRAAGGVVPTDARDEREVVAS